MSYQIIYGAPPPRPDTSRSNASRCEEFSDEHQALGRARELIEDGEHHGVKVRDQSGNELSGVRLQLRLGGFSGN